MRNKSIQKAMTSLLSGALLFGAMGCGSMDEVPERESAGAKSTATTPTPNENSTPTKEGATQAPESGDPQELDPTPKAQLQVKRLRNGLTILPVSGGPNEIASIRLTVEAGSPLDPKGKSGLAMLCARCLIEIGNKDEKGAALADRLAQLSATLHLHMEGRRAGFEISGPRRHLLAMARILFDLMTGETPDEALVEEEKRRLLQELSQTREGRLRLWQIQRSMGMFPPTPKEQEDQLASLETSIVQLFYTSYYRPQSALLSIEAENFDEQESKSIQGFLDPWMEGPEIPAPSPLGRHDPVNYTPWEGPGAEIILMMPDPDPAFVGHGAGSVAWQIASLDGYGGWIGERLAAEGLGEAPLLVENHVFDRLRVRCLSYRIETSLVPKFLQTLGEAFAVLGTEEPSSQAFRVAVRRARLAWDLRMSTPEGRIEALDLAYLADHHKDLDQRVIESITKLRAKDYPNAAAAWVHPQVLIRGPKEAQPDGSRLIPLPKESARPVTVHEKVQTLSLSPGESAKLAASAYVLVQDSIAGADTLLAFGKVGYEAKARFVASIPFSESWSYEMSKGKVERRRTILSTEIRTFTKKNSETGKVEVIEIVEGKSRILGRGESELFQIESVTQPHALLATMLRQKVEPKLGGRLKSAGRSFLVLDFELFGQELRLLVDEENGLPRRLIYKEWRKGIPARSVTLLYEAYDKDGRFQLPRRISKYLDGEFRGEFLLSYPRRDNR